IEEAAGVLKHRKRKEKALRKLDAMMANLTRVSDLNDELRRQLKPLGRQADIARRAATIQAEARDSRLRLLADDLVAMRSTLEGDIADETAMRERRTLVEQELGELTTRESELDDALAAGAPALNAAQESFYELAALRERVSSTARLAAERHRNLSAPLADQQTARDPQELDRQAEIFGAELDKIRHALNADKANLIVVSQAKSTGEGQLKDAEAQLVLAVRAVADRREGLARLTGQVNSLRTRAAAGADEIARLDEALAAAGMRATEATAQLAQLQRSIGDLDEGEHGLDERHERALAALSVIQTQHDALSQELAEAEQDLRSFTVRRDALAAGLKRKDGSATVLGATTDLVGVLGPLAQKLEVRAGYEAAIAAALGQLADAAVVADARSACDAIELLKDKDAGQAALVIASSQFDDPGPVSAAPEGTVWASELITADQDIANIMQFALRDVVIVSELVDAVRVAEHNQQLRAVTKSGDTIGRGTAHGGSSTAPSLIEVQAAVDEAESNRAATAQRISKLRSEITDIQGSRTRAQTQTDVALDALHESDARMSAVAEELAQLGAAARGATAEADRLTSATAAAEQARDKDLEGLADLEERLQLAESAPIEQEPSTVARDDLADQVAVLRQKEVDTRLGVRTGEERVRALESRVDSLRRAAANERAAAARLSKQRAERADGAAIAVDVHRAADYVLGAIADSISIAQTHRDQIASSRIEREAERKTIRERLRALGADLERLTSAVHRDEVARTEQRLRIEQLDGRATEEFGISADVLIAEYGPHLPVPATAQLVAAATETGGPKPTAIAFDRAIEEKRAAKADRDLRALGKINPLALEEFAALEERAQFLGEQLVDLKATRRDLLIVVADVDARILEVFSAAYEDVAREFQLVFQTLFPGGEGKLILTDPDNMLTTGIEVEARPPGKKIKRLSLLSGGERSLTAVALLVAIFRARPSPFYVLDEVEAALDDVNLGRLIGLFEQLRSTSQLIIITHQKRTMEIADALYGVTMRGDGITQVISQRIRSETTTG
ncbi:MAG: chromosome segregation protein SMC, partial [Antricoccus sp.]